LGIAKEHNILSSSFEEGTMKYVQFMGNSQVEVREKAIPQPAPGEVLIQVVLSAICGSEIHSLIDGVDHVPNHGINNTGHEMVGLAAEVRGSGQIIQGQRVGVNIMHGCGKCVYCLNGVPFHCSKLRVYQNAHSEYVVVPESCLVPLPDDLSWDESVLMCGDMLGTPYHALKRLGGVNASQRAAIFGCGPIGIGCLVWLKHYGLYTIVSEISPFRQELARQLGADLVLDPTTEDVAAHIRDVTGGGAEICLDCAGVQETNSHALDAARIYGQVGFIGEKKVATIKLSPYIIRKELTIFGSWYFTNAEFYEQVEIWKRGLCVDKMITHRYTLDQAPEAYPMFTSGQTGKVVFYHEGVI
jgi:threonine dehydrogenase-like Zn-dependent dehydrogenase